MKTLFSLMRTPNQQFKVLLVPTSGRDVYYSHNVRVTSTQGFTCDFEYHLNFRPVHLLGWSINMPDQWINHVAV